MILRASALASLLLVSALAGCALPSAADADAPDGAAGGGGGASVAAAAIADGANAAADAAAQDPAAGAPAWRPCEHPWPCGDGREWPADLVGPFDLGAIIDVAVETSAGVLDGWALLPDVPEGTRVPVVLEATPYPGQCGFFNIPSVNCRFHGNTPAWAISESSVDRPHMRPLVDAGYAFVTINLPGTGASEGCFDDYGPATQQALSDLIEALAAEPWSNGRVGMIGISASGTSPFAAAIKNPPSLKTIVPLGVQSNLYTFSATPQGALAAEGFFHARYVASVSATPPATGDPADLPGAPLRASERLCPDVAKYALQNQNGLAGDRDLAFWQPRMLILDFPEVTASVMTVHGFDDAFGSGHAEQDDDIWQALAQAPQRMILGQWDHEYPVGDLLDGYQGGSDWWADVTIPWFDFWLKGLGEQAPRLGFADWQDDAGAWHNSTAWPPGTARDEVLYLDGGALAPEASGRATAFTAGRTDDNPREVFCGGTTPLGPMGTAFAAPAVNHTVEIAGNPYLHLRLTSDAASGLFEARLYDLAPDFVCLGSDPDGESIWLSEGAVDLRYHAGNLAPTPFAIGQVQDVRVDFWNIAHVLEPGHRLAVIFRGPGASFVEQTDAPVIALEGNSRLVLPLVAGTLGGVPDAGGAPLKPFLPPESR